jgi:hypothetical protein
MGKRTYFESCKLVDLRLLESSSKYLNPDLKVKKVALSMRHEVKFEVFPEKGDKDFYLDLNTELTATAIDGEEYFVLNTRFRGDYAIIGNKRPAPEKFKDITELLGHQLFPVVRTFMTNVLVTMGLPLPMPWSVLEPQVPTPPKSRSQNKSESTE